MPVVTFLPAGRTAAVAGGTSLLDAAAAARVTLAAPCGGEGICGECRVRITSGAVEEVARGALTREERAAGWTLACSSRVAGDITVEVPGGERQGLAQIVTEGAEGARAASEAVAEPVVVKRLLRVPAAAPGRSLADLERLARAIRDRGGPDRVTAGADVLRGLAAALRAEDGLVTVALEAPDTGGTTDIVRIEPGDTTGRAPGLAVDVGTTTCAVSLVDVANGRVLGTAADYNRQLERGADVISRIHYARTPERVSELRRLALDTINPLVTDLCSRHGVAADGIDNAVVAGNTTMIHLLLGLDPDPIRREPYTPTVNRVPRLRGGEVGLAMSPAGRVLFAPGVGSYVGGDIVAGLLQTALAREGDEARLFLDFGTNGEIAVGDGRWLMACAASAGPAFEGGGVRCGMRAGQGAIERARIDPVTGSALVNVIGGGPPRGICGSGMIDLLAELRAAGLLDPSGKLDPASGSDRIRPVAEGSRYLAYTVVPAGESGTGEEITLDDRDIQNLLRTKAAVYAACALMLNSVGLDLDAIEEIYVAGGFGRFLDVRNSIRIGLLPDRPPERFTYLGNSSLAGARAMLCGAAARRDAARLADRITYQELNVDPAYMSEYTAALFLPHTDLGRFPTVMAESPREQGPRRGGRG